MLTEDQHALVLSGLKEVDVICNRIIKRLPHHLAAYRELQQLGRLGLVEAAHRYNPTGTAAFLTYADYHIEQHILDYLRSTDRYVGQRRRKWNRTRIAIESHLLALKNEIPQPEECAGAMGVSLDEYQARSADYACRTAPWVDIEAISHTLAQASELSQNVIWKERYVLLADAFTQLPEKQKILMTLYYFYELELKDIASIMEMKSTQSVWILKRKAEDHLRKLIVGKKHSGSLREHPALFDRTDRPEYRAALAYGPYTNKH